MARTSWKYKLSLFLLFMLAYSVFYIVPNFRPVFQPMLLPLLALDRATPLVPWTFLIYISDYVLVLCAIVMLHGEAFHAFARKMFLTLFFCGTFFIFLPTVYPRPEYPAVDNAVVAFVMWLVRNGDMPTNCFPSMHVALTAVSAWCLRPMGPRVFVPFVIWSIAIFISTMTTKQHYFTDILGGLSAAAIVTVLERWISERGWLWLTKQRFKRAF